MVDQQNRRRQLAEMARTEEGRKTIHTIYETGLLQSDNSDVLSVGSSAITAHEKIRRILDMEFPAPSESIHD